jgi:CheY-like chemotaxis protein
MPISTLVVEDDAFTRVTLAESLRAQGVEVVLATEITAELKALPAAAAPPADPPAPPAAAA